MAVNPKLTHFRVGSVSAPNVIELYLDFVCPYSKKQFETLYTHFIRPTLGSSATGGNGSSSTSEGLFGLVQIIFRPQVQPWHPASTLLHESAIAVSTLSKSSRETWTFMDALFRDSDQFYDSRTVNEPRSQTYARVSTLLARSVPTVSTSEFLAMLDIEPSARPEEPGRNSGNETTGLLKSQVKLGRQNGIHVSPTVVFNGLVEPSISSSFTKDDWSAWFNENLS